MTPAQLTATRHRLGRRDEMNPNATSAIRDQLHYATAFAAHARALAEAVERGADETEVRHGEMSVRAARDRLLTALKEPA